jgi:uncharacterized protein YdhG (YjbR/CyaY superfamily)
MKSGFKTVDEYLETVSDDHRVALEKLRKQIKAAAPKAEECISYGVPTYKQNGMLLSFGAAKNHCAFYPGAAPVEKHKEQLASFDLSKGTIRFQPNKPIPATLVKQIVKERLAENESRAKKKKRR